MENNSNGDDENKKTPDQPEENSNGAGAPSEIDVLKEQLQKVNTEMLYLKADFENYKKRVLKERSDLLKYGAEPMVRAFLDLLDNFERALSLEIKTDNLKSFADGIRMIHSEFKSTLNRFGVSEIEAAGKPFDPSVHEALGTEPSETVPSGHITKVFSKPYKLHDRLVRPGRVIISKEGSKAE